MLQIMVSSATFFAASGKKLVRKSISGTLEPLELVVESMMLKKRLNIMENTLLHHLVLKLWITFTTRVHHLCCDVSVYWSICFKMEQSGKIIQLKPFQQWVLRCRESYGEENEWLIFIVTSIIPPVTPDIRSTIKQTDEPVSVFCYGILSVATSS